MVAVTTDPAFPQPAGPIGWAKGVKMSANPSGDPRPPAPACPPSSPAPHSTNGPQREALLRSRATLSRSAGRREGGAASHVPEAPPPKHRTKGKRRGGAAAAPQWPWAAPELGGAAGAPPAVCP